MRILVKDEINVPIALGAFSVSFFCFGDTYTLTLNGLEMLFCHKQGGNYLFAGQNLLDILIPAFGYCGCRSSEPSW